MLLSNITVPFSGEEAKGETHRDYTPVMKLYRKYYVILVSYVIY
jgi:hypothetical protein